MKKLSIIIPTYNRRDFLEKCMYCVCETANPENFDLYIWDNGSTDDTSDFLASYKQWDFIKPLRSKINIGTECSQKILSIIKTPYIMTLEPDAWIHNKEWDKVTIDCFETDENIGSIQIQYYNDERNQLGVTWEGKEYKTFTKPRFRCENLIYEKEFHPVYAFYDNETIKNFMNIDVLAEANETIGEHEIKKEGYFIPCSGLTIWKTELVKNHIWIGASGLITDLMSEWGECIKKQGMKRIALKNFWAYHCSIAPWFHLGREYEYWKKKTELAPILYNRSSEVEWSWYNQAKEWSGWGNKIPDSDNILKQGFYSK